MSKKLGLIVALSLRRAPPQARRSGTRPASPGAGWGALRKGWCAVLGAALSGLLALPMALAGAPAPAVQQVVAAQVLASEALHPAQLPADARWTSRALPDDWALTRAPSEGGSMWYRVDFDATGLQLVDDVPAVYIERACSNVAVFLNGLPVGSGGAMRPPYARNCFVPQLFALPQASLREGRNQLLLQVVGYPLQQIAAAQRSSGLSALRIGPLRALQPLHAEATFWRVTVARTTATILLVFAALFAALWLVRRKDDFYAWFALWIGWWGLNATRSFISHETLSSPWVEALVVTTTPLAVAALVLFKTRYAGVRLRGLGAALALQALVVPLLVAALGLTHLHDFARVYYVLAVVQYGLVSLWFVRRAWGQSRRDFWMFLASDLLILLIAAVEYASGYLGLPLKIQLAPLAGPVTLMPVALRLLWLMAESLTRSEGLNEELERRVAEKSAEIARSYAELSVLRAREAVQAERQRIAADLHDDLGARLLSMAHASGQAGDDGRLAGMARQALDEMRLSVRGMVSEPARAADALADWRAESVERLGAAGWSVDWTGEATPPELLLPARLQVQLTRVLREAVSNMILHSGGRRCRIGLAITPEALTLTVEDDGRGLPDAPFVPAGLGLPGIERRVRALGGAHRWTTAGLGGARLWLRVPLSPEAGAQAAPDVP